MLAVNYSQFLKKHKAKIYGKGDYTFGAGINLSFLIIMGVCAAVTAPLWIPLVAHGHSFIGFLIPIGLGALNSALYKFGLFRLGYEYFMLVLKKKHVYNIWEIGRAHV